MKLVDSRLARTLEDLSDFSFTIKYCPGQEHVIPDALSRLEKRTYLEDDEYTDGWLPPGLVLIKKVDGGADSLFEALIQCVEEENGSEWKV